MKSIRPVASLLGELRRAFASNRRPLALLIRPTGESEHDIRLLFPAGPKVFGQVRLSTSAVDRAGQRRIIEILRRMGFERVTARSPQRVRPPDGIASSHFIAISTRETIVLARYFLSQDPTMLGTTVADLAAVLFPGRAPKVTRAAIKRTERVKPVETRPPRLSRETVTVDDAAPPKPLPSGGGGVRSSPSPLDTEIWNTQQFRLYGDEAARSGLVETLAPLLIGEEPVARRPKPPTNRKGLAKGASRLASKADPPRTSYALLSAPEVVTAGSTFELTVGISSQPTRGVAGKAMRRPASNVGPYTLTAHVVASGFKLGGPGQSWRQELRVTARKPYPTAALLLEAKRQAEPITARAIQAIYSVGNQTIGLAVRPVAVVRSAALASQAPSPLPPRRGVNLTVDATAQVPDLTVRILYQGPQSEGRLAWTFESPHVAVPPEADFSDVENQPDEFARLLVLRVNALEGKPGLYPEVRGIGRRIAKKMPGRFWQLLRDIGKKTAPAAPDVLLLSREPYIPWELAVMPSPLLDSSSAPFLAAQTNLGRWVFSEVPPPQAVPPGALRVGSSAVISGTYGANPGWNNLPEAEAEAAELSLTYGAKRVNAVATDVLDCLEGRPRADLLHFAVHGQYDPNGLQDGLMLIDGQTLSPDQVEGMDLKSPALVFLNACQVGSGSKTLGDYSGLAAAFLDAGAAAVIAPLWSIDDATAKEIALRFYADVFRGASPASVLRLERAKFQNRRATPSATFLAYQFFGHPGMVVSARSSLSGGEL